MDEIQNENKDLSGAILTVLVNRAGGTASIRPNEFLPNGYQVRATQLPTGTIHLELVAIDTTTSDDTTQPSTADDDALMHLGG